jgi:hypothetical protein
MADNGKVGTASALSGLQDEIWAGMGRRVPDDVSQGMPIANIYLIETLLLFACENHL